MAEEHQSTAQKLFDLLKKDKLSEEQTKEVETIIQTNPTVLFDKEFTEKFEMPDLLSTHEKQKDVTTLIKENEKGVQNIRQVLNNLKSFEINGKNAAAYILEKGYLSNGELIGTQAIKNMHFLGTAKRESETPEIKQALENQGYFLMELYEGEYPHNKNARNMTGQKASDLLNLCIDQNKYEDKRVNQKDDALETLHNQSFMKSLPKERVEETRRSMTANALKERIYRGTATVEDKAAYQKIQDEKNIADWENVGGDMHRQGKRKPGEKFKEEDIVKYLYEEWFLALLSWGFDKVEDGMMMLLDEGIEGGKRLYRSHKEAAKTEPDPRLKPAEEIVSSFEEAVNKSKEALKTDCEKEIKQIRKKADKLSKGYKDSTKEKALKEEYGADILRDLHLMKDPETYLKMAEQGFSSKTLMETRMRFIAMDLTKLEMIDEMMRSDKAWRNPDGKYKSLDQLTGGQEFGARVENRLSNIMKAWDTLSADIPLRTEAEFSVLNEEEKEKFVQKHILDAYDGLIKDPNLDTPYKNVLKQAKETFTKQYISFDKDGRQSEKENLVFSTFTGLKKMGYLKELETHAKEAQKQQNQDILGGKFDALNDPQHKNIAPNVATKRVIQNADSLTQGLIDQGMNDSKIFDKEHLKESITAKSDLRQALKDQSKPEMARAMLLLNEKQTDVVLADRRNHYRQRRQRFEEYMQKMKSNTNPTFEKYFSATKGGRE